MSKKIILIPIVSLILVTVGSAKAASSSGTATFKITPSTSTIHIGDTVSISGQLNTGNTGISAYQIVAYLSYTTATSPVLINATTVTTSEPALNCLTNTVSLDSGAKKYTLVIACGIPFSFPPVPYTTSGTDKTMFTFNIRGDSPGILTLSFNNSSTLVNSATDASDILAIPNGGTYTVVGNTATPTPTPTPMPTPTPTPSPTPLGASPTPTPTSQPNQPNSCNGTCGSNPNCQAGLFCSNGYCRNPFCSSSTSCVCPTPHPTPIGSPQPTAKVVNPTPTPTPTPLDTSLPTPTPFILPPLEYPTEQPVKKLNFFQQLLTAIANFLLTLTGQK